MYYCKACGKKYVPRENKITKEPEDLCGECLLIARYAAFGIEEDITDDVELSLDCLDYLDSTDMGEN